MWTEISVKMRYQDSARNKIKNTRWQWGCTAWAWWLAAGGQCQQGGQTDGWGGGVFLQSSSRKENRTQSPWHSSTLKKSRHQLPSWRDTDTVNCITVSCATLLLLSALPSCRSECCWFLIGFLFYFLHTSSLYNLWSQKSFLAAVRPQRNHSQTGNKSVQASCLFHRVAFHFMAEKKGGKMNVNVCE